MAVGTVERVNSKSIRTSRGPSSIYSMLVDGTWYSTDFNNPTKYGITNGAVIEYEPEDSDFGPKINLKTVSVKTSGDGSAPAKFVPKAGAAKGSGTSRDVGFPIPATNYQISILRQHAVTQAREFMDNCGWLEDTNDDEEMEELLKKLFDIAGKIADYTSGRSIEEKLKKLTDEME